MYNRENALTILKKYLTTENLIKHSYAVEAVMKALAEKIDPDNTEDGLWQDCSMIWIPILLTIKWRESFTWT